MQERSGSGVTIGMKLSPEQEALHRERDATVIVTAPCSFWDRRSTIAAASSVQRSVQC